MQPLSIIGVFCDDIRQEIQGTDTIVGVFPDNINVPMFPFVFPKLSIYLRILFDIGMNLKPGAVFVRIPGIPEEAKIATIDEELINQSRANHEVTGTPIAGIICRATLAPFPVPEAGRILVFARIGDDERICAGLNIQKAPASGPSPPTEPLRPS